MNYRTFASLGTKVSSLSFGASSLGGVFHAVDEDRAVEAVRAALDCGINYFDVAPAYGGTRAETVLGRALRGVPRESYLLSTKVGKYTRPGEYGKDTLDFSRRRILASIDESAERLGTDYFDVVYLHDIEYQNRTHTEQALSEGLAALKHLQWQGRIGAVGFGIYPLDLWQRLLGTCAFDGAMIHNHYCLNDTSLLGLLPLAQIKSVGIVNASPFASGLLTDRGPPDWHPAGEADRATCQRAAAFCRKAGESIAKLALQFASQHADIPTTMFSSANPESVRRNVQWHEEPFDPALLAAVQEILLPVRDKQWAY